MHYHQLPSMAVFAKNLHYKSGNKIGKNKRMAWPETQGYDDLINLVINEYLSESQAADHRVYFIATSIHKILKDIRRSELIFMIIVLILKI